MVSSKFRKATVDILTSGQRQSLLEAASRDHRYLSCHEGQEQSSVYRTLTMMSMMASEAGPKISMRAGDEEVVCTVT